MVCIILVCCVCLLGKALQLDGKDLVLLLDVCSCLRV